MNPSAIQALRSCAIAAQNEAAEGTVILSLPPARLWTLQAGCTSPVATEQSPCKPRLRLPHRHRVSRCSTSSLFRRLRASVSRTAPMTRIRRIHLVAGEAADTSMLKRKLIHALETTRTALMPMTSSELRRSSKGIRKSSIHRPYHPIP